MLTHPRLLKLLSYSKRTGVFKWKVSPANQIPEGAEAGSTVGPYCYIKVGPKLYLAHRLAWFYVTKRWPASRLDHRNGDKRDNRWANLRLSDAARNGQNRTRPNKNSSSKLLGAHPHGDKFTSSIMTRGVVTYLGIFETAEAAHEAYVKAKKRLHKH